MHTVTISKCYDEQNTRYWQPTWIAHATEAETLVEDSEVLASCPRQVGTTKIDRRNADRKICVLKG
jgi:uncharacterized protein YbbK (DUF523 family)